MAVFPESMDRLDSEDVKGSFAKIQDYVRYMGERIEFSFRNMTKTVNEAGVSSVEIYILYQALQNQTSAIESAVNGLRGDITALQGPVAELQSKVTTLTSQISDIQTQIEALDERVTAMEDGQQTT